MKLRRVLGSFAWVALAAALILVNAAAANAQDKAAEAVRPFRRSQ